MNEFKKDNVCLSPDCRDFQQHVSDDHKHTVRCIDALCKSFQQWVAENHKHKYPAA